MGAGFIRFLGNQTRSFITIGMGICKFVMLFDPLKSTMEICYLALAAEAQRRRTKRMTQKRNSFGRLYGPAVAGLILGTFGYIALAVRWVEAASLAALDNRPPSFSAIAKKTMPVVVNISTTAQRSPRSGSNDPIDEFFSRFFGDAQPRENSQRSLGSGILISSDGEILTSYHVVRNADAIKVKLADQTEYEARLVGKDDRTDLALIKIRRSGGNLPFARLGSSSQLDVGDWVMAIGNPFGLEHTVTAGIVSAKGRVIGAGPYDSFIQTDASINPGNSGGPLINASGEVVGVNSAIFSQSGGNVGIGFAIPINLAKQLLPELETTGSVTRGWLGVTIQHMTPELAKSLGVEESHGALVADVTSNSPAAKAGMERGDVIVRYNKKKVEDSGALPTLVAGTPIGETVPVEVVRNGKAKTLNVTVAKLTEQKAAGADEESAPQKGKWGLALRELQPEEREQLGLKDNEGVMVGGVQPESPAAEAGVESGDVILQVNKSSVSSVAEAKKEIGKTAGDTPLLLLLRHADGNSRFATLAAK